MTDEIVEFRKTFADWMEVQCEWLKRISGVLQDINSTLAAQRTEKGTAPRPSERTLEQDIDPPKDTLMQELAPYSEYLRHSQGKYFIAKYMDPEVGCFTDSATPEIYTIMKRHDHKWYKDKVNPKESHWRKK